MRKALALFALAAAAFTAIQPHAAFEAAVLEPRDVNADLVADGSAYHSAVANTCTTYRLSSKDCTITVTNKGAASSVYYVTEAPSSSDVSTYSIGGSASVSSGRAGPSASVSPGATTTITAHVPACGLGCFGSNDVFFTVEGEKADTLSSIQTRVRLIVTYT